jgi:hypothetical protein
VRRAPRARSAQRPARRRRRAPRPHPDEATIDRRVAAGEDPEIFLCVECGCWMLDPAYCLCRERALW